MVMKHAHGYRTDIIQHGLGDKPQKSRTYKYGNINMHIFMHVMHIMHIKSSNKLNIFDVHKKLLRLIFFKAKREKKILMI